jgi:hypothetical protein
MKSAGVEVKPLRELTGNAMFNTVFIDDVFVPDELVLGEVDRGWEVSRNTLTANGFRSAAARRRSCPAWTGSSSSSATATSTRSARTRPGT